MNRARAWRVGLALAALPALSGCVAAALPVLAGGTVLREQLSGGRERGGTAARAAESPADAVVSPEALVGREFRTEDGRTLRILPGTELPPPGGVEPAATRLPAAAPAATASEAPPPGPAERYLYDSGEAAALSLQSYQALWNFAFQRWLGRNSGETVLGTVLAGDATLASPSFVPCGEKPLAVVFDVDQTVLLEGQGGAGNSGAPVAVPGAAETIAALRRSDIAVVFNSDEPAEDAPRTAAMLEAAGLGPVEHGSTLWLRGDAGGAVGKDARRRAIAERYCVIALVGDRLGDFSDLFDAAGVSADVRRNTASETMIAPMWGAGWFMLPNPITGASPRAAAAPLTDPAPSIPPATPEGGAAPEPEMES